ncbi:MAG: hypothetical protein H7246_13385, partial [Phycisphaerae bacterium]|nr:hypothetical protein [Saprospiraceae bacterium]
MNKKFFHAKTVFAPRPQKLGVSLCRNFWQHLKLTKTHPWTVTRYYTREKRRLVELTEPDPGCWVHLAPPFAPDELDEFARRFDFDPAFLTDSLDLDERARY